MQPKQPLIRLGEPDQGQDSKFQEPVKINKYRNKKFPKCQPWDPLHRGVCEALKHSIFKRSFHLFIRE